MLESDEGEHDGEEVRFLRKLKTHEVSPVMLGAGIATRTLVAKSGDTSGMAIFDAGPFLVTPGWTATTTTTNLVDLDEGKTLSDETGHALGSVQALADRYLALGSLRADGKAGRVLSAANRDRLATLVAALDESSTALRALLEETDPNKGRDEGYREFMRFLSVPTN